jgi:transcriptional regulator with XRE-family HTH domain
VPGLAQGLWALRRAAGLTQRELATRAGVSETTVCECECGRRRPRPGLLAALTRVLGSALAPGTRGARC